MKANVQISAVKKEFKNGQQGWQVFVEGMQGRFRCEMNFKDALKAMRYMFMLSKRLDIQIDEIQLTALMIAHQRSKGDSEQAQAPEAAEAAAEVPEAEQVPESKPAPKKRSRTKKSPMRKQFDEMKKKHPDALLLFRCGDFYECFEEDAVKASEVLGITLTKRSEDSSRMAGFPAHALDAYLPKLIRAGLRVAICDELEVPKKKGE